VVRVSLTLAEELLARGRAVDLLVGAAQPPCPFSLPPGLPVVLLRDKAAGAPLRSLQRYLLARRPAGLIPHMPPPNLAAILAHREAHEIQPVVICVHMTPSRFLRDRTAELHAVSEQLRAHYRKAVAVVVVSREVADDLARVGGLDRAAIHVIRNGVRLPVAHSAAQRKAPSAALHPRLVEGTVPVVLGVGRLAPEKGFATLLEAIARLLILGDGEERAPPEQRASALGFAWDVALPGFRPDPLPWLRRAALFVLSSRHEGVLSGADRGPGLRHAGGARGLTERNGEDAGRGPLWPSGCGRRCACARRSDGAHAGRSHAAGGTAAPRPGLLA
jgi:glycosyltransferase involved in cell wall biosynthesis